MSPKLIFGIFLPIGIIIILVVLSTSEAGFSAETLISENVHRSSLFTAQNEPLTKIPLLTINVKNDFFLPKKYVLPRTIACINDNDGKVEMQDMQIKYSQGVESLNSNYDDFSSYSTNERKAVELPAYSERSIKLVIMPKYLYNYATEIQSYMEYDELLIVDTDRNTYDYNRCMSLNPQELASARHVPII